jgi:hypothetical protein
MLGPLWCLIVFIVYFLFSWSSISQKNDVAQSIGPFGVRKVPKSQNMQKQENQIRNVKTKRKGIV